MEEIWKDVVGWESYYQISNLGRVCSKDRVVKCKNNKTRTIPGKILKPSIVNTHGDRDAYFRITFKCVDKIENMWVHRLVATAFIENPENLPCVNHKDEDRFNNSVENLEWCSYKYNSNYGTAIERAKRTKASRNYIVSDETRHKMSLASKGRKHTIEYKQKMSCIAKQRKRGYGARFV